MVSLSQNLSQTDEKLKSTKAVKQPILNKTNLRKQNLKQKGKTNEFSTFKPIRFSVSGSIFWL